MQRVKGRDIQAVNLKWFGPPWHTFTSEATLKSLNLLVSSFLGGRKPLYNFPCFMGSQGTLQLLIFTGLTRNLKPL